MAEFEDKLNAILSDPESMAQILQLAQNFSSPAEEASDKGSGDGFDFFSLLGSDFDPGLITKLLPLIKEYGKGQNSNASQLLKALQPFLKEERQAKVDQALQLARILRIAKVFLQSEGGLPHV
ncbi:MAG: hypothetical protein IJC58_00280 [Oscillospiraceae bacterium]|nr:hypothetical protein [Oscillospiraceae bacterium]